MSKLYWQKTFPFSASLERSGRVYGYNYELTLKLICKTSMDEEKITQKIQADLIQKLHSRDLCLHVDFLHDKTSSDSKLLTAFASVIKKLLRSHRIVSLRLKRDSHTETELVF